MRYGQRRANRNTGAGQKNEIESQDHSSFGQIRRAPLLHYQFAGLAVPLANCPRLVAAALSMSVDAFVAKFAFIRHVGLVMFSSPTFQAFEYSKSAVGRPN